MPGASGSVGLDSSGKPSSFTLDVGLEAGGSATVSAGGSYTSVETLGQVLDQGYNPGQAPALDETGSTPAVAAQSFIQGQLSSSIDAASVSRVASPTATQTIAANSFAQFLNTGQSKTPAGPFGGGGGNAVFLSTLNNSTLCRPPSPAPSPPQSHPQNNSGGGGFFQPIRNWFSGLFGGRR